LAGDNVDLRTLHHAANFLACRLADALIKLPTTEAARYKVEGICQHHDTSVAERAAVLITLISTSLYVTPWRTHSLPSTALVGPTSPFSLFGISHCCLVSLSYGLIASTHHYACEGCRSCFLVFSSSTSMVLFARCVRTAVRNSSYTQVLYRIALSADRDC
jgi:hypothetical protein